MTKRKTPIIILTLVVILLLVACGGTVDPWQSATYLEDTELGEGARLLTVEVVALERKVVFTIHTDSETVGDALAELDLVEGEETTYGLYIKKVNGMRADYELDGYYWAFYENGDYALSGADTTAITEGVVYRLEYSK